MKNYFIYKLYNKCVLDKLSILPFNIKDTVRKANGIKLSDNKFFKKLFLLISTFISHT